MRARIPAAIWALGLVSMFMDISSEMIHSLLPMFLATSLGVSATAIGLIEGLAEATALIVKVFSGVLSDWLGKRKGLALLGYALGAFTKPFFALATGAGLVVAARLVDRVGKGIRGARATPWWPTSRRPKCAARPSACASRWTPSGPSGAAAGHRLHAAVGRRLPRRVLGGGGAGRDRRAGAGPGRARARAPQRRARTNPIRRDTLRRWGRLLVGGGAGQRVHAGPLQRGLSGAAGPGAGRVHGPGAAGDGGDERGLCRQAYPFGWLADRMSPPGCWAAAWWC
jgi:hypothetical protein